MNNIFCYKLLMYFADELNHSEIKERDQAYLCVREKVADALLYLVKKFKTDHSHCLNISLSRQDIADLAGTTKEQVSKILAEFKEDGVLELDKKRILIPDCEKLKEIVFKSHRFSYQ
ncbi:MAG: winged helix-turn-helix domain-containing protein [Bacteroidetes bacterium]|nr:winged helix-turn-helix domain-containing protein [Bacteroidota bacterium]